MTVASPILEPTVAERPREVPSPPRLAALPAQILCRDLCKVYRKGEIEVVALDSLDLAIAQGSFVALMGPSGSGKSTLLNMIAGLDTPTSGWLRVGGVEVPALSQRARTEWRAANVGFVFQSFNLVPVLTAFENVNLPLALKRLGRKERQEKAQAALELVGLADRAHHYPHQLSQGQEQRVALARAIVSDPPILLADEPTGNLDARSAHEVIQLFRALHAQFKKTVVIVTHDPRAAEVAETVHRLDKGRLVGGERR
ncbi:MAG TPA: ABC transporter ATP-binding protein [Thermoanaerobaculia bacterium]|nr:ABC transporter ATP-binding protein [Thermoanaerobaculia bacterium]